MKRFLVFSFLLSLLSFISCSKNGTSNLPQGQYAIQVANGEGAGSYNTGDTVNVYAQTPANNQVFDRWTGDAEYLSAPYEWHTTLKMPSANINLTATYKTAPAYNYNYEVINGSNVYYYVPSGYKGLILLFHGSTGSASYWTVLQPESMNFTRYAVANGYAVLAIDCKNRVTKNWDLTANSIDVNNIDVILNNLHTRNIIAPNTKLFAVGMSDGGAFCSSISYQRDYKAVAIYCFPGLTQVYSSTKTPTLWNMGQNDVTHAAINLGVAKNNFNTLNGRGITSGFYVNEPYPVNAGRFTIVPGLSDADGAKIIDGLKSGGFIDNEGKLLVDVATTSAWKSSVPAAYKNTLSNIQSQLTVCYTQHEFYKDSNYRTIEFFNRF